MKCPYCGFQDSKVIDSRAINDGVRRRRECMHCSSRFTTYERVQVISLYVIKKDGRREEFNRPKLTTGIRKACEKRPLPMGSIERMVDDIEAELQQLGRSEVATSMIGEMVMQRLRETDHIAYIRFASVYRPFADIQSLRDELEALARTHELTTTGSHQQGD